LGAQSEDFKQQFFAVAHHKAVKKWEEGAGVAGTWASAKHEREAVGMGVAVSVGRT
jgi:hypothetical protein